MVHYLFRHVQDRVTGKVPMLAPARSGKWRTVEKKFLAANPHCAVCSKTVGLNVHHIKPYHLAPADELNWDNLITLCRAHHETFGHLEDWKSYNVHVVADTAEWSEKIEHRPRP